jgi:recombination protein RecA
LLLKQSERKTLEASLHGLALPQTLTTLSLPRRILSVGEQKAKLVNGRDTSKTSKFDAGLIRRGLEGFQNRAAVELQPSGVTELDAVLGGGFPRGSLVELCGPASSGRTSLAFSLLAQSTERQEACAFVDVSDSLDPISLAAAGVELPRLLWVRCGDVEGRGPDFKASSYFAPPEKETGKTGVFDSGSKKPLAVNGWRHPRELMRGVDKAIPSLIGKQAAPAVSAQLHVVSRCAGEQVERDRELPRRGFRTPRSLPLLREFNVATHMRSGTRSGKPWKRLEQALKTTDLLLHGGGWGVVVIDLGGISWVDARRIELNTWFRFRRAVENTPTILLLLGEESCAKSCASLVLRCQRRADNWSRAAASVKTGVSTFEGFEVQGEVTRSRVLSQPADFAHWQTRTP